MHLTVELELRTLLVPLAAMFLGLPARGHAQEPWLGLRAGLSVADFGGQRIVDSSHRGGLVLGAFTSIRVTAALTIQPEVTFSRRGAGSASYDYHDLPADGDAPPIGAFLTERTTHDYLEVPFLLKLSAPSSGALLRPALLVGPYVGFLLNVREVYATDYTEYLRSRDAGMLVGGALELGRVSLDVRYSLGLTAIAKDYDASYGRVPAGVKNRAFTLTAGLRLL